MAKRQIYAILSLHPSRVEGSDENLRLEELCSEQEITLKHFNSYR